MAKILIAEDEPYTVQLCTAILEREGHAVTSVNSGLLALEKLESEKPDLLVLDVMLPAMDGYTIALHMSREPALSSIPVIVTTGMPSTTGMFSDFGQVRAILNKPFSANQFTEAVRKSLEKPR